MTIFDHCSICKSIGAPFGGVKPLTNKHISTKVADHHCVDELCTISLEHAYENLGIRSYLYDEDRHRSGSMADYQFNHGCVSLRIII